MTLERGDSPLAGRRPAPLSSVAGLGAMNSLSPIGGMHGPGNMKPRGMPALGSLGGSLNSGTLSSVNGGSLNSLGSNSLGSNSLGGNTLGGNSLGGSSLSGNSLGSNSLGTNSLGVSRSGQSVNPPVGQPQSVGQTGQVPERNSSSFWLDLQNVERWFDKLDTGERTTLLTSLFYRSPEGQLLQFSSALEMAMRNQPAASSNLSRFGVRHNQTGQDVGSVYTYRPPVSAGGASSPQGKSVTQNAAPRTGSAATPAGSGSAHALGFTGAAPASNGGHDLYNNAFLPLPRSHPYSPWGTEIRRPNSAAADAWPDARGSPLQSASNSGSPNISALSLDTPQASSPSTHSPIGHPLKPWRTFAPHQNTSHQHASLQSVQSPIGSAPSASVASAESPAPISIADANSTGNLRDSNALTATKSDSSAKSDWSSAEPTSSTSPSGSPAGVAAGIAVGNVAGSTVGSTVGSALGSNALGQVPKDNRLARRNVDVVDAELLSDIGAWLRSLRLHKYTGNLSGMRWQDVILLSDKDLEDRGVNALGARRKLLKMFEEIRTAQEAGQLPEQTSL